MLSKVNVYTDASFVDGVAGISCIIKKNNGDVNDLALHRIMAQDILVAELSAILFGAKVISNRFSEVSSKHDKRAIRMYTDNKMAVGFINRTSKCPKNYLPLVREIQKFNFSISWIERAANKQADALAVYAARRGAGFSTLLQ